MKKVNYPIDKHQWSPSLIPGPVVLISTTSKNGEPNVAPKSWVQFASFDPPILMFSGNKGNPTENNILETNSFAVNLVDSSMAETVFDCIKWHGKERIEKCGFELVTATKIDAPLMDNCKAHIECRLIDIKEMGSGFVLFVKIVAVSIWDKILNADKNEGYKLLDQIMFLEDGVFGKIVTSED